MAASLLAAAAVLARVPLHGPHVLQAGEASASAASARDDLFTVLHIQKTAGTAMQQLLQQFPLSPCLWGVNSSSPLYANPYVDGYDSTAQAVTVLNASLSTVFPNSWCAGGQLMGPHASLAVLRLSAEAAGKARLRTLTILREPIARALSEFNNVRRTTLSKLVCSPPADGVEIVPAGAWEYRCGGWAADRNLSLHSFLNSSAPTAIAWSNRQTRMLAFPGATLRGPVTAATRAKAVAAMDGMDFVGLTERFEDSVLLMRYVFRDLMPSHIPNIHLATANADTSTPVEPTPAEKRLLVEANAHDTALYAAAAARFDRQWAAMLADERFADRGMRYVVSPNLSTYTLVPAEQADAASAAPTSNAAAAEAANATATRPSCGENETRGFGLPAQGVQRMCEAKQLW